MSGTEKNSFRHRDLNPDFHLYVLTLYPLSHTGFPPNVELNPLSRSTEVTRLTVAVTGQFKRSNRVHVFYLILADNNVGKVKLFRIGVYGTCRVVRLLRTWRVQLRTVTLKRNETTLGRRKLKFYSAVHSISTPLTCYYSLRLYEQLTNFTSAEKPRPLSSGLQNSTIHPDLVKFWLRTLVTHSGVDSPDLLKIQINELINARFLDRSRRLKPLPTSKNAFKVIVAVRYLLDVVLTCIGEKVWCSGAHGYG
ncbi:hypothetical protein ANN_02479 [Periplaneta americana]|uniref:Uncharacterized protein n=1 Tax=Periplaneta americana TaxID=6978 RepID=A0ABQ8TXI9_PERAM|nr:hypothetical protein ANN_02479 [Periplaneta americana]